MRFVITVLAIVIIGAIVSLIYMYLAVPKVKETDVLNFIGHFGETDSYTLINKFGPRVEELMKSLVVRGMVERRERSPNTNVRGKDPIIIFRLRPLPKNFRA